MIMNVLIIWLLYKSIYMAVKWCCAKKPNTGGIQDKIKCTFG